MRFIHTLGFMLWCRKATTHSGTFGFAYTLSNVKKPKEPEFCSRSNMLLSKIKYL